MYTEYFGFNEKPFKLVPNPEYLFLSKSHEIALAHLTYATDQGEGFVVLTGEVGTGKTTLCRNYLERLDENTESAYIFNPNLEYDQLLGTICNEFGIDTQETNAKEVLEKLYAFLIRKNASDKNVVLVIDEAQSLSIENLELVRMLSNLETTRSKLLQIVLVGQPELEERLESYQLRQLAQRISLSYHLAPLSLNDTNAYIRHRLGIASKHRQSDLFTADACRLAYRFSRGIPRLINIVCDRALLTAFSHNRPNVTKSVMQTAITEIVSRGKTSKSNKRTLIYAGACVCLLAVAVAAGVFIRLADFKNRFLPGESETAVSKADIPELAGRKTFKVPDDGIPKSKINPPVPETGQATNSSGEQVISSSVFKPQSTAGRKTDEPASENGIATDSPSEDVISGGVSNTESAADLKSEASSVPAPADQVPVPNPDHATDAQPAQVRIVEIIGQLEPKTSRKKAVTTMLSIWHQPRPNAGMIPDGLADDTFFKIIARQYGLRAYEAQGDWDIVRRLNLPAIVALNGGTSSNPVYLTLVGWHDQTLIFEDGQSEATIESDFETIRPLLAGPVYIFWENVLGYDIIISKGSDSDAILEVKALLRKIGYDHLSLSPEFDLATRAAVLDFQARHNLSIDGLVGPVTKIMLLQEIGKFRVRKLYDLNRP